MWKSLWLAPCLILLASVSFAQNGENEGNGGDEGTLPRLEITPGETDPGQNTGLQLGQDFDSNSDFIPPSDQDYDNFDSGDAVDLPNFPSLSQQSFGDLNGAARLPISVFELPSFGTVTDRQTLDERMSFDMIRALQQEVGVLIQSTAGGQASPFIRGLTGQEVLILIDGIRLNNSTFRTGPNQYFNTIDPGMVDSIQVIRGPQSVAWGSDAIGGAINIVTRGADPFRGNYFDPSFTNYFSTANVGNYSRANIEGSVSGFGVFGGASYLNANDIYTAGILGVQPATGYDQNAGDIKLNYLVDEWTLLTVALNHFEQNNLARSDRFEPFINTPTSAGNMPNPRNTFFDPQQRELAYIRLQGVDLGRWFDAYTFTASFSRQRERVDEERIPPDAPRTEISDFNVDTIGFSWVWMSDLDFAGQVSYGFDYYHDDIDASRIRMQGGATTLRNPQYPDDSFYERFGVFMNWHVPLTERLSALAGVRYEHIDTGGTLGVFQGPVSRFDLNYHDWVASAGLSYALTDEVRLVGGFYEGFRAPNLDDLASDNTIQQGATDSPSLDVQPEHSYTYEAGVKVDSDRFRSQAFVYYSELDDKIERQAIDTVTGLPEPDVIMNGVRVPGSDTFIRSNQDSYIYGTEVTGEYLLDDQFSVYGNCWYTFGQNRVRNEPLSRIPPLQGILGLKWRDNTRRRYVDFFTWMVSEQDRYAAQNNNDVRFPAGGTPGYATLNLRVGACLDDAQRHRVSVSVENLTNEPHRVYGSGIDGTGLNGVFGYQFVH